MKKLLIIDGHNLLFQMFFGMPARIVNKQGKAIQGVLGFVGALNKIIKLTEPTHIVVVFDGEHENDRAEILPEYKANRIDYSEISDNENPFSQLGFIYDALDFMGIKHFEADTLEADDVIAGYAITYKKEMQIVISSFDSDFFQLVDENVSVLRYRGDKTVICGAEYIQERFGISPNHYADFKSLTGDNSDNIKGAEKVGVKTAAALIKQFGSLDNIISGAKEIAKPSVRESIAASRERLRDNYKLIKLENNAELKFDMNDLIHGSTAFATNEVLREIGVYDR